ncbi:MAG: isoprenylcysteine carboxylmethyltransferase family protein [Bacteroidales bacterium]
MKTQDNPGILIPPPLIYAAFFGLAYLVKSIYPINVQILKSHNFHILGWVLILITLAILLPGLWKFWRTKNTLVTIKPANSLQTKGIYAYTRNPMYLGLLLLYTALACFSGNCWTLIFLPVLFIIVQVYIIRREEKYLDRAFAEEYKIYRKKVRRWI